MLENETPNSTPSAAESALLDQRVFRVTTEQYDEFVRLLERPPRNCPGLRDLFSRKDLWDDSAPADVDRMQKKPDRETPSGF